MSPSDDLHPFDTLTAALGRRRLYSLLWGFWLFLAMCGHYALMLPRREVVTTGAKVAIAFGIGGLLTHSWLLIRGLASKERRKDLLTKIDGALEVRVFFRVLVWLVPLLGLGALLSPILIQ